MINEVNRMQQLAGINEIRINKPLNFKEFPIELNSKEEVSDILYQLYKFGYVFQNGQNLTDYKFDEENDPELPYYVIRTSERKVILNKNKNLQQTGYPHWIKINEIKVTNLQPTPEKVTKLADHTRIISSLHPKISEIMNTYIPKRMLEDESFKSWRDIFYQLDQPTLNKIYLELYKLTN